MNEFALTLHFERPLESGGPGRWWASAPSYSAAADSFEELLALLREGLAFHFASGSAEAGSPSFANPVDVSDTDDSSSRDGTENSLAHAPTRRLVAA